MLVYPVAPTKEDEEGDGEVTAQVPLHPFRLEEEEVSVLACRRDHLGVGVGVVD